MLFQRVYLFDDNFVSLILISNVLYLCCESSLVLLPADTSVNNTAKEDCSALLLKFASNTANFTHCSIMNARPINLCESCVDQYLNVIETHEKILKLEDETGEACRKKLINLDRLEIIEHGYGNVLDLWESAHCSSCFSTNNRTLEISNITVNFNKLHKKTNDCIQHFYNSTNKTYDPAVCTSCSEAYCKMNEFYDSLKDTEGDGKICIDIVDSMNTTRSKWSTTLNCGKKMLAPEVPLLLSLMIISLTPVGFYIAAKVFSSKVESRVLPQKRLGHLNYPSTSRLVS